MHRTASFYPRLTAAFTLTLNRIMNYRLRAFILRLPYLFAALVPAIMLLLMTSGPQSVTLSGFLFTLGSSLLIAAIAETLAYQELKLGRSGTKMTLLGAGAAVALQQTVFLSHLFGRHLLREPGVWPFSDDTETIMVETMLLTIPFVAFGIVYARVFWRGGVDSALASTSVIAASILLYQYFLMGYHSDQAFAIPFEIFFFPLVFIIDCIFIALLFILPGNRKQAIFYASVGGASLSVLLTLLMHLEQLHAYRESELYDLNYPFEALGPVGFLFPLAFCTAALVSWRWRTL